MNIFDDHPISFLLEIFDDSKCVKKFVLIHYSLYQIQTFSNTPYHCMLWDLAFRKLDITRL